MSAAALSVPVRGNAWIHSYLPGQGDHSGRDLYAVDFESDDLRIHPAAEGYVAYVGFDCSLAEKRYANLPCDQKPQPYYGNTVVVDHGDGTYTAYAHLRADGLPKLNAHVSANDVIGFMSNTGCGGCIIHLHFVAYRENSGRAGLRGRDALWGDFAALNAWALIPGLPNPPANVTLKPSVPDVQIGPGPKVSIPRAPSNVHATANGTSQIVVTWTDNSNNEGSFQIVDCLPPNAKGCTVNENVGVNSTSFTLSGLSAGQYKCFAVRANSPAGDSDWSDYACATTQAAASAPAPNITTFTPSGVLLGDLPKLGEYCMKAHPGTGYVQTYGACAYAQFAGTGQSSWPVIWNDACRMQYPNTNAVAKQTQAGNNYSWRCYTP